MMPQEIPAQVHDFRENKTDTQLTKSLFNFLLVCHVYKTQWLKTIISYHSYIYVPASWASADRSWMWLSGSALQPLILLAPVD